MALYRMYCEEGAAFVPRYVELLSAGCSRTPAELFAPFGVDLADPAFWDRGFMELQAMVERAESLLNALRAGRRLKR